MNIKRLIGIAAISTALLAGATYAYSADEEVCRIAPFTDTVTNLLTQGVKASPVSEGEVKHLTDEKGMPPGAEGKPFEIIRLDMNDMSMLLVRQGDCINDKVGPVPSQLIDNVLGSVKASG